MLEAIDSYVLLIPLVIGVLIPFLTELVTKASAPPQLKSGIAIALSILGGVVTGVSTVPLELGWSGVPAYLLAILVAWLTSGRVWLTGFLNGLIERTQNVGIGDRNSGDKGPNYANYTP